MNVEKVQDYSDISKKVDEWNSLYANENGIHFFSKNDIRSNVNLGIYQDKESKRSYKYCGYAYLKDMSNDVIYDSNNEPVILHIKPRFGLDLSAMLQKIADDDEFFDYLGLDTDDPMIEFFYDEPMIDNIQPSDDMNRVIMAVSYIALLERTTRVSLIKKMVTREENMVGRVKGHINFRKQISQNIVQGHKERIYSVYNCRTEDIDENRLLLQALDIAEEYLGDNITSEMCMKVSMIRNRLWNVSRKSGVVFRYDDADRMSTKLSNIYRNYAQVFEYAKLVLKEGAVTGGFNRDSKGVKIIPYAVNSHMLYECYSRACFKARIDVINNDSDLNAGYKIEMLRFVRDKNNIPDDPSYGAKNVIKKGGECYISGKVVPDIVLKYVSIKDSSDKKEFYRVYDVKYKDPSKHYKGRDDRLQLLAYNLIYHPVDDHTAFIMPKGTGKENESVYGCIIHKKKNFSGAVFLLDDRNNNFSKDKNDDICKAIKA